MFVLSHSFYFMPLSKPIDKQIRVVLKYLLIVLWIILQYFENNADMLYFKLYIKL